MSDRSLSVRTRTAVCAAARRRRAVERTGCARGQSAHRRGAVPAVEAEQRVEFPAVLRGSQLENPAERACVRTRARRGADQRAGLFDDKIAVGKSAADRVETVQNRFLRRGRCAQCGRSPREQGRYSQTNDTHGIAFPSARRIACNLCAAKPSRAAASILWNGSPSFRHGRPLQPPKVPIAQGRREVLVAE